MQTSIYFYHTQVGSVENMVYLWGKSIQYWRCFRYREWFHAVGYQETRQFYDFCKDSFYLFLSVCLSLSLIYEKALLRRRQNAQHTRENNFSDCAFLWTEASPRVAQAGAEMNVLFRFFFIYRITISIMVTNQIYGTVCYLTHRGRRGEKIDFENSTGQFLIPNRYLIKLSHIHHTHTRISSFTVYFNRIT